MTRRVLTIDGHLTHTAHRRTRPHHTAVRVAASSADRTLDTDLSHHEERDRLSLDVQDASLVALVLLEDETYSGEGVVVSPQRD